jgi:hypothetical protein
MAFFPGEVHVTAAGMQAAGPGRRGLPAGDFYDVGVEGSWWVTDADGSVTKLGSSLAEAMRGQGYTADRSRPLPTSPDGSWIWLKAPAKNTRRPKPSST